MPKVVFISNLPQDLVELILSYSPPGFEASSVASQSLEGERIEASSNADFLILYGTRPSEALLRASPKLRHIQLLSAGYEGIDLHLTEAMGIPVSNNGGANSWAVAEATVGLI